MLDQFRSGTSPADKRHDGYNQLPNQRPESERQQHDQHNRLFPTHGLCLRRKFFDRRQRSHPITTITMSTTTTLAMAQTVNRSMLMKAIGAQADTAARGVFCR